MVAVIGMDLSKQSSEAVAQIGLLYQLNDIVLVHGPRLSRPEDITTSVRP